MTDESAGTPDQVSTLATAIRDEAKRESELRLATALSDARGVFTTHFPRLTPKQRDHLMSAAFAVPGTVKMSAPDDVVNAVERELIDRMVKQSRLSAPPHDSGA